MTNDSLQHQADRAEALAAQTVDKEVKQTLLDAAREYREKLKTETCEPKPEWNLPKEIS
jgi:hypothetical protein